MENTSTRTGPAREVPQDFTEFLSSVGDSAKAYTAAEKAYIGALVNDRLAKIGSLAVMVLVALPPLLLSMLLGLLAGAKAWGEYLGNEAVGYLCMSGAVFANVILFVLIGRSLQRFVQVQIFNKLNDDNED